MENIRIYEEDGYIHFIMRPEDLMRLQLTRPKETFGRLHGPLADPDENGGAKTRWTATATHLKSTSSRFSPHEEQRLLRTGMMDFVILST